MKSLKKSLLVAAMVVFGGTSMFAQTRELGPEWGRECDRRRSAIRMR